MRRSDANPGAVADLVFLVEQIDDIKAEFEPFEPAGIDLLHDAQIDLMVIRQTGAVRGVALGPQSAAVD